ncbi:haloacid dehalogenase-like hydrolase domain-containing protein 3 [Anneissia japonica]|uniref:haloacid dehalogenase-like hydrolase domain-containing protein 3 n=1 Tax=Anneissia japonica TaxID=1529436 RepID=UPI001425AA10|nr:haloacid dehalogenase-like hydrolase domain-containing protein 3 [Anneissia japonica]XP_033122044.1 haloacid dehalogenase-like hydrolase domain-containing protein 3 [Anneissia japonica]
MNKLKLLTFDVNNTLIRVQQSVGHQYSKAASTFGIHADPGKVQSAFFKAYAEQKSKQPNYGEKINTTTEIWWTEIIKRTFSSLGHSNVTVLEQIGAKLFRDFQEPHYWDVYPEVKNVLTYLNRKGICLGVISNFDERLVPVLKNLDLASHFAFIIQSVFAKCEKPDPKIFQMAMSLMKLDPGECLHIGDSVKNDFYAAQDTGMNACLIDRDGLLQKNYQNIEKKQFLQDLEELRQFVS